MARTHDISDGIGHFPKVRGEGEGMGGFEWGGGGGGDGGRGGERREATTTTTMSDNVSEKVYQTNLE